ncbi:hypothetical protein LOTGIDRAFT_212916 [Lottia gigantea]|uniref:P-type domain-containing protein n=1 Tax=Lottia gigantea TaxID=225164 RepID=V4AVQ0_LOTGI|nr:hypothetical protein LOTGIDRAFT_212916 [Lottia gigantea]ESP01428.1 hypothetical protein LOTGIDRAFT_212916 [Lottia gigantea]
MTKYKYSKLEDSEDGAVLDKSCDGNKSPDLPRGKKFEVHVKKVSMRNGVFCEFLIILIVFLLCLMLIQSAFTNTCLFSKVFNYTKSSLDHKQSDLRHTPSSLNRHQSYFEIVEINIEEDVVYQEISQNQVDEQAVVKNFQQYKTSKEKTRDKQCYIVDDGKKFDCHPEAGTTKETCEARGCCYYPVKKYNENPPGIPYCYYPLNYPSYTVDKIENKKQGYDVFLSRKTPSYYPQDEMNLKMEIKKETSSRLHIKISNQKEDRWEVPLPTSGSTKRDTVIQPDNEDTLYSVAVADVGQPFGFQVNRTGDGAKNILETAGGFIFADQFLQLSYFLPSQFIYGLGEHRDSLLHSMNWTRFVLWNRDQPPTENGNLYGSHPFYLMMENDGNSHGVLLLNSNAIEVLLQPAPAITWRSIGGVIDLYMFLGPNPSDVIQQYTEVIGRTFMPPYWSLGFHLCRWGFHTVNETMQVVKNMSRYGIPQDVQWNDIDYMDAKKDFTTDLKNFGDQSAMVDEFHKLGLHYIMIIDPGISSTTSPGTYHPLDLGLEMGIFIKDINGKPIEGKVWPGNTYFPDFTHPDSQKYWTNISATFHNSVQFDGIWIDMNEISNFVAGSINGCPTNSSLENPPYLPAINGNKLSVNTLCLTAQQYLSSQYNVHNLYGFTETRATHNALVSIRQKRPFVITRSTFVGSGYYGGHWSGDNYASYHDLYRSISESLSMNMFGVTIVGADICGFRGDTTEELCTRWHQLGAFYTFSRNHNNNGNKAQDPASFGPALAKSTRKVLLTRYTLLPYLYTLIHKSHMMGHTVMRPLFFEYPTDVTTYNIDKQFLWGPALLITPVLDEGVRSVEGYFPKDIWYDFYTGQCIVSEGGGQILDAPLDKINLHVRGGYILPWQYANTTTTLSRKNKFGLLVALNSSGGAEGDLFWDDGDTLDTHEKKIFNMFTFTADSKGVYVNAMYIGLSQESMYLGDITVFGVKTKPASITVNNKAVQFVYNDQYKVLYIAGHSFDLYQPIRLLWTF